MKDANKFEKGHRITEIDQAQNAQIVKEYTQTKKLKILEDKALFFQGQLSPLHNQNLFLKQQIIQLKKIISQKTDELRKLLNSKDKQGKNRNIEIETGNITDICMLIKKDWDTINDQNQTLHQKIVQYNIKLKILQENKLILINTHNEKLKQVFEMLQNRQREFQQKIGNITRDKQVQIKKVNNILKIKQKDIQMKIIQLKNEKLHVGQLQELIKNKCKYYQTIISKLNADLKNLNHQIEQYKKNFALIHQKQLQEKIDQLTKGFLEILQSKEEQKKLLLRQIQNQKLKYSQQLGHIKQQSNKYKKMIQDLLKKIDQINNELKNMHIQKQNYEKMWNQSQNNLIKMKITQQQMNKIVKKLKKQIQNINIQLTQFKNIKQTNDQQIRYLKKLLKEQQIQNKKKLKQLFQIQEENLKKLKQNYILKSVYENIQQLNNQLSKTIEDQKNALAQMEQQHNLQLQKIRKNYENKIRLQEEIERKKREQLQEKYQQKIINLQKKWKNEMKNIQQQNRLIIKQLNDKIKYMSQSYQKRLFLIQQRFKQEKTILENQKKKLQKQNQMNLQQKKKMQNIINKFTKNSEEQLNNSSKKLNQESKTKLPDPEKLIERQIPIEKFEQKQIKKQNVSILQSHLQIKQSSNIQKTKINKEQIPYQKNLELKKNQKNKNEKQKQISPQNIQNNNYLQQNSQLKKRLAMAQKSLQQEKQKHKLKLVQINQQFQSQIIQITNRLETDLTKINDLLLEQKQKHLLTKLTKQQKIEYLNKKIYQVREKIKSLQALNAEKDNIINLKNNIIKSIEQELINKKKQMQEYENMLNQQFINKLQVKQRQWKKLMDNKTKQNAQIVNQLQTEFMKLRMLHNQQIQNYENKYNELINLFSTRPSRKQDLSMIKNLLEEKYSMTKSIQIAEIKVKQANQIVKYLKLELENYKQVYNIFGPSQLNELPDQIFENQRGKRHHSLANDQIGKYTTPLRKLSKIPIKIESIQQSMLNHEISEGQKKNIILPSLKKFVSTDNGSSLITSNLKVQETSNEVIQNASKFMNELKRNQQNVSALSKNYIRRKLRGISHTKKHKQTQQSILK